MTCKDCIHYNVCQDYDNRVMLDIYNMAEKCKYFKDKSRYIELPCNLGQIVYDVVLCDDDIYRIFEMKVSTIVAFGSLYEGANRPPFLWNIHLTDNYTHAYRTFSDIGTKIFFTKEKAEERLKELNENA